MNRALPCLKAVTAAVICTTVQLVAINVTHAKEMDEAEQLYAQHCAVCHGADRGGYIGPALNSEQTQLKREQVEARIIEGGVTTLMPQHPAWPKKLSGKERGLLAELITSQPKKSLSWGMDDIRNSLQVLVEDESTLPAKPVYQINDIDDLMVVMGRGRFAAGEEAKVVFFDGRRHKKSR